MLKNYLKLAWKVLLRRKFFTFISLFGISFTLVVLMLATALLDHVIAQYPPETKQDRTVGIYYAHDCAASTRAGMAWPGSGCSIRTRANLPNVEKLSIATFGGSAFSYLNGQRVKSYMKRTDGVFWEILDFQFLEGHPYTNARRARTGAWSPSSTNRRAGDSSDRTPRLGRTIDVDGQRFTVVGVVPDVPILRVVPFADIWVPLHDGEVRHLSHASSSATTSGFCCCRIPAKVAATRDEFWSRLRTIKPPDRMFQSVEATPETLFDTIGRMFIGGGTGMGTGYGARLMIALTAAACLFMLLPAVNLMNLNTSRIMERASEIGVRKAFGASSRTLVGQFVVENVVLTLVGAAIGFVLAAWLLQRDQRERHDPVRVAAAQLPHLRLGRGARGRVRPALGRLSRLAHVAAAPGAGAEGSLAMIRHLFKLIWNRKRTNVLMMTEIFVSFLVLFAVVGARRLHAGQLAAADRLSRSIACGTSTST